jgi:phenylacetate-CoA ligase
MLAFVNRNLSQPLLAWRSGSKHLDYLRLLRARQFDHPTTVESRQFEAVRKLLFHAYETVPYYRNLFIRLGCHPGDFKALADLSHLPVLTKTAIRKHARDLRSSAYVDQPVVLKKTSGSTGVPLTIAVNAESIQWKTACTIRSDEWSGWKLGQRVAKVWGNPEYRKNGLKGRLRNLLVDRARYLDTIGLDDERMHAFADSLRRRPTSLLFGHAHSLYLFACFARKRCPGAIRPRGIISTAMLLHDWQRLVIEKAFECPVTNRYGCEEVSLIASECEQHRGLHLNADSLYPEVLPDRPGAPGEGSLAVTDLTNLAMPLIRYQVGDVVAPSNRRCSCGRGLSLIERVEGREADYVLTPQGKLISGISLTENFALHIRGTAQVQIVQEHERLLLLRIVPDDDFGAESRNAVAELVRDMFGPEMEHEIELVDAIAQEPSGKYRFCISKVAGDFLKSLAS